jgi:hypothetical protein
MFMIDIIGLHNEMEEMKNSKKKCFYFVKVGAWRLLTSTEVEAIRKGEQTLSHDQHNNEKEFDAERR